MANNAHHYFLEHFNELDPRSDDNSSSTRSLKHQHHFSSNKAVIITSCMQNRGTRRLDEEKPKKENERGSSVNREDRREKKEEHLKRVTKNKFILYLIITHSLALALGKSGGNFGSLQGHKRANLNLRMSEILFHLIFHYIGSYSHTVTVFLGVDSCA